MPSCDPWKTFRCFHPFVTLTSMKYLTTISIKVRLYIRSSKVQRRTTTMFHAYFSVQVHNFLYVKKRRAWNNFFEVETVDVWYQRWMFAFVWGVGITFLHTWPSVEFKLKQFSFCFVGLSRSIPGMAHHRGWRQQQLVTQKVLFFN